MHKARTSLPQPRCHEGQENPNYKAFEAAILLVEWALTTKDDQPLHKQASKTHLLILCLDAG